jgi:hypothetical protein
MLTIPEFSASSPCYEGLIGPLEKAQKQIIGSWQRMYVLVLLRLSIVNYLMGAQ